ncbi:unnamed protein product, partial [Prorocentrum cordatum]
MALPPLAALTGVGSCDINADRTAEAGVRAQRQRTRSMGVLTRGLGRVLAAVVALTREVRRDLPQPHLLQEYLVARPLELLALRRVMERLASDLDTRFTALHEAQSFCIDGQVQRIAEHHDGLATHDQQIAELREGLRLASAAVPVAPTSRGWERVPDPCVVVITTERRKDVPLGRVQAALQPLIQEAQFSEGDYTYEGDELGSYFKLRVRGAVGYASKIVGRILACQQNDDKSWKRIEAQNTNGMEAPSRFFSAWTRTSARSQARRPSASSKRAFEGNLGGKFYVDREQLALTRDNQHLVRIEPANPGPHKIYWNLPWLRAAGLQREQLEPLAKFKFLYKYFLKKYTIMVQESHGHELLLRDVLHQQHVQYSAFGSYMDQRSSGGVTTFVPKVPGWTATPEEVYYGRDLRVHLAAESGPESMILWNVHNQDIPADDVTAISAYIQADLLEASADPVHSLVIVGGDFNITDEELQAVHPSIPSEAIAEASASRHALSAAKREWLWLWSECTELHNGAPTHYQSGVRSRLDRLFTGMPPWMLTASWQGAHVVLPPDEMHHRQLSDHALISVQMLGAAKGPQRPRPILKHYFTDPRFEPLVNATLQDVDVLRHEPPAQVALMTKVLRNAASSLRDLEVVGNPADPKVKAMMSWSASRAYIRGQWRFMLKLMHSFPALRNHFAVTQGEIRLLDAGREALKRSSVLPNTQ